MQVTSPNRPWEHLGRGWDGLTVTPVAAQVPCRVAGPHLVSPVQEQQLAELAEVRQVLQADLGTSIRRIADLQVALEGLRDSDDSDAER